MHTSRVSIAAAALLALTACGGGGGGGGGGSSAPTLVAAAFIGAGVTPVAGDVLQLTMSDSVQLVANATLNDEDFDLSPGTTLGTITVAATRPSVTTIRITLGAGVNFTPGTSTIAFGENNDAVTSATGALATGGTVQTITTGDGQAPTIDLLTLNDIPTELNGRGAAGGTLQVPRSGFTIDATVTENTGIDASTSTIIADVNVAGPNGTVTAGNNIASLLTATISGTNVTWSVPATVSFPAGAVLITVIVADTTGLTSAQATFDFITVEASDDIRPFESTQVWFIDDSRDIESFTASTISGAVSDVNIVGGANGTPDLYDLFEIVGLHGSNTTLNAAVTARFKDEVLVHMNRLFSGVDIQFTFDSPGTFPENQLTAPFGSFSFSQICLAGAPGTTSSGTLGAALLDANNASHENDCEDDFQGIRLGVFLQTAIRVGYRSGPTSSFRSTFDPLTPAIGGDEIGSVGGDSGRVSGATTDSRTDLIDAAIDQVARLSAAVLAHECGHSMGLVQNGAMPTGLYGGDTTNFSGSSDSHIRNDSLFSGTSQNIMSPAINFDAALSDDTSFNPLNQSYLRETALYEVQ